jgi:hypothetical protein
MNIQNDIKAIDIVSIHLTAWHCLIITEIELGITFWKDSTLSVYISPIDPIFNEIEFTLRIHGDVTPIYRELLEIEDFNYLISIIEDNFNQTIEELTFGQIHYA